MLYFFVSRTVHEIKNKLPLHVSLHRIKEEQKNVENQTNARIAVLMGGTQNTPDACYDDRSTQCNLDVNECVSQEKDSYNCLNTFCCCVCLLIMNMLYWQWFYIRFSRKP